MTPPVCINGKFALQRITGVQRVAHEIVRALDLLEDVMEIGKFSILVLDDRVAALSLQHEVVGHRQLKPAATS